MKFASKNSFYLFSHIYNTVSFPFSPKSKSTFYERRALIPFLWPKFQCHMIFFFLWKNLSTSYIYDETLFETIFRSIRLIQSHFVQFESIWREQTIISYRKTHVNISCIHVVWMNVCGWMNGLSGGMGMRKIYIFDTNIIWNLLKTFLFLIYMSLSIYKLVNRTNVFPLYHPKENINRKIMILLRVCIFFCDISTFPKYALAKS